MLWSYKHPASPQRVWGQGRTRHIQDVLLGRSLCQVTREGPLSHDGVARAVCCCSLAQKTGTPVKASKATHFSLNMPLFQKPIPCIMEEHPTTGFAFETISREFWTRWANHSQSFRVSWSHGQFATSLEWLTSWTITTVPHLRVIEIRCN